MARLIELGHIEIEGELSDWIAQSIEALGANTIELSHEAAMEVSTSLFVAAKSRRSRLGSPVGCNSFRRAPASILHMAD